VDKEERVMEDGWAGNLRKAAALAAVLT